MSKWSQVPFSNRFMFRLVMENHEICKRTLELLLGIEIAELDYVEGEKSIEAKLSSKGIRDVCNFLEYINTGEAKDEFTREIDAEVVLQRSDENKAVMRTRR